ncbi:phytanoyl-CoA dioxygenase family protein [Fodinicurvata halophila]|uniref:Phytanoyl-CoA dioxygenase family protein n=1 Tax=Fodinicurvata halophila TaxID=1419723 RepID=A0ABV8UHQ8_9PROT
MRLSDKQIQQFHEEGFLILPNLFSKPEIDILRAHQEALFKEERPENIREKQSGETRTAFALHRRNTAFSDLSRHPRLIEPARQILQDDDLYIQQLKVNVKAAFVGEVWQWHYDFATHHEDDGVPEPLALNLHVFLDDVNHFNGPLWFIPRSHKAGPVGANPDTETTSYRLWVVDDDKVAKLVHDAGDRIVAATGAAGTAMIFGDTMVHGSPPNMSPWPRRIFSAIANPVSNKQTRFWRPDYIHEQDFTPIECLPDDCLFRQAAAAE